MSPALQTNLLDALRTEERAALALRSLYARHGYSCYKMGKFEEYDLYARNKDFLVSEGIISFTDLNGKLMALKPDVTLSILRHVKDSPGAVQKVFYDENVYRASRRTRTFREIPQVGLECVGAIDGLHIREVLSLAAESLRLVRGEGRGYLLELSHLGILAALMDSLGVSQAARPGLMDCLTGKNPHELARACEEAGVSASGNALLRELMALSGRPEEVLPELRRLLAGQAAPVLEGLGQLKRVVGGLEESPAGGALRIDFSVVNDLSYYNGIVFRGFVEGVPAGVLSGGQYDLLARRMGHAGGAIGFALYLDLLEHSDGGKDDGTLSIPSDEMLNIALPKGRLGERVYGLFERAGFECPGILEKGRRLIFENAALGLRFFWVKPVDVPVYVERGAADIGAAGKDILMEYGPDVYELLDLRAGLCRMAVAAREDFHDEPERTLRVATEFPNIAQHYYAGQGRDIDVIPLRGSLEIAPVLGLSDVIVDIVETGTTLRENHLRVVDTVAELSARLIANKASLKFKEAAIGKILRGLSDRLEREDG